MATEPEHRQKNARLSNDLEHGKFLDESIPTKSSPEITSLGCSCVFKRRPPDYSTSVFAAQSTRAGIAPWRNSWTPYRAFKYDYDKKPRGWRAMPYIMGNEICEKVASTGLLWNLVVYLVQEYHMKKITAANVANVVSGTTGFAPLLGAFIADAYAGRFPTILIASVFNLLGMVFLVMTATVSSLKPSACPPGIEDSSLCQHASGGQLGFLFTAFLFLSISSGGLRPCTYAFGADQFGQESIENKKQLQSFFNWYYFIVILALLLSSTVIVYLQQDVSWAWGFGVPAIAMAISMVLFVAGYPSYRHEPPEGSKFTGLAQVVVAAVRKRKLSLPSDQSQLYDNFHPTQSKKLLEEKLHHTNRFRFLDKAAIKTDGDLGDDGRPKNPWRLCPIQSVEELKCILAVAPIWSSGILLATNLAQQGTFLVLQALTMDRRLSPSFQVPPGSMGVFGFLALIVWVPIYDRVLVPTARRITGNIRGITLLQRIGIGYVVSVGGAVISGAVESKRRALAISRGLEQQADAVLPISVFWLIPQLAVTGVAESFNAIGQIEFFYDQMPASMKSVAGAMFWCSYAAGSYLSTVLITVVQKATERHGNSWLSNNLNLGHLDFFYYLLAVLLAVNFVYFFVFARFFTYKNVSSNIPPSLELHHRAPLQTELHHPAPLTTEPELDHRRHLLVPASQSQSTAPP